MICPRCAKENEPENRFCGRCGLDFSDVSPTPAEATDSQFCYKHKKEPTNLSCGRCGRPICHRCVIVGPAGPRCRECGRHKVPIKPRAVAGEAKLTVQRVLRAGPFAIYLWLMIAMMLFWLVRGCMVSDRYEPRYDPDEYGEPLPEPAKSGQDSPPSRELSGPVQDPER